LLGAPGEHSGSACIQVVEQRGSVWFSVTAALLPARSPLGCLTGLWLAPRLRVREAEQPYPRVVPLREGPGTSPGGSGALTHAPDSALGDGLLEMEGAALQQLGAYRSECG